MLAEWLCPAAASTASPPRARTTARMTGRVTISPSRMAARTTTSAGSSPERMSAVDGAGPRQSAGVAKVGQRRLEQSEHDWEPPRSRWSVATDQVGSHGPGGPPQSTRRRQ